MTVSENSLRLGSALGSYKLLYAERCALLQWLSVSPPLVSGDSAKAPSPHSPSVDIPRATRSWGGPPVSISHQIRPRAASEPYCVRARAEGQTLPARSRSSHGGAAQS